MWRYIRRTRRTESGALKQNPDLQRDKNVNSSVFRRMEDVNLHEGHRSGSVLTVHDELNGNAA